MADRLPIPLTTLQAICKDIEDEMVEVLMQFEPVQSMQVGDMKYIARAASAKAFEAFDRKVSHG